MTPKTTPTTPADVPPPDGRRLSERSIPLDIESVPRPVREATNAVHAAEARVIATAVEHRSARAEAERATLADRQAAAAAEREGREIPPLTKPALDARVKETERAMLAAQDAQKAASRAQDHAVMEHGEAWHAAALAHVDALLADHRDLLDQLDRVHDRLAAAGAIVRALDGAAKGDGLFIQWPSMSEADRRQNVREKNARSFNRAQTVDVDLAALLGAVEMLTLRHRGAASEGEGGKPYRRASWPSATPDDRRGAEAARVQADLAAGS